MRLNKLEKIIVAVILLGLILIGGTIIFVKPSFDQIGRNTKTLQANIEEKASLEERLSRLDTIDADIEEQKKDALKYEGCFYPDLTSYEASEIAMALLNASGLEAHSISVSQLGTRGLGLEFYKTSDVTYPLREYSSAARNSEGDEEETLSTDVFIDGGKKYTVSVSSITDVSIIDPDGNAVDPSKYTEKMKRMYKIAVCRLASMEGTNQTVGTISATYTVKGTYKQYEDFVNHIFQLDRATYISSVVYPITEPIQEEEESDAVYADESGSILFGTQANDQETFIKDSSPIEYSITLEFLCVEPMDKMKTITAENTEVVVDQRPAVY
ncbi:MAG: hypothetical protein J6N15_08375 [Ruminiclostridium sp.]|nr:hypothetical protein [Ruminiclostridium sp.]